MEWKETKYQKRCENVFQNLFCCVGNSIFCNGRIYWGSRIFAWHWTSHTIHSSKNTFQNELACVLLFCSWMRGFSMARNFHASNNDTNVFKMVLVVASNLFRFCNFSKRFHYTFGKAHADVFYHMSRCCWVLNLKKYG